MMRRCPLCKDTPTAVAATANAGAPRPDEANPAVGFLRRAWRSVRWVPPAALLVLTPKCPMCVIAYVGLFTGIGISVATARWIQVLIPAVCLTALGYLVVRLFWRRRWLGAGRAASAK